MGAMGVKLWGDGRGWEGFHPNNRHDSCGPRWGQLLQSHSHFIAGWPGLQGEGPIGEMAGLGDKSHLLMGEMMGGLISRLLKLSPRFMSAPSVDRRPATTATHILHIKTNKQTKWS